MQRSEEVGPENRAAGGVSRASSASSDNDDDRLARSAAGDDTDTIVCRAVERDRELPPDIIIGTETNRR